MMRKFVSVLLLSMVSAGVMALGLGNIQLDSGLNQPFDARITLLSPTAAELDSMAVRLADADAFGRAGIDRPFVLTSLRFEVQQSENGDAYIHITSREPLREPFLNFLIEATWSNGKLFREYTVLLDPPLYDPNAGRVSVPQNLPDETAAQTPATAALPSPDSAGSSPADFNGSEVGPTGSTDTLWAVASRVRSDESVSVNQMMMALLRANPDAFIGNNINGLKQGQILRVPDAAEVNSMSSESALEEVRSQNALWEQIRTGIASNVPARPATVTTQSPAPAASASSGAGSELRLLSPGDQSASPSSAGTGALANEQLQSLASENADLRDRLTESEQIIQDLRRLIELKDDELAALQQNINAPEGAAPETVDQPAETTPDAVTGQESTADASGTTEEAAVAAEESSPSTETAAAEEVVMTEPATTAEEPVADESTAADEAVTEEPSESAPMIEVDSAPATDIVGQILDFVFGNIALVGGGLVVIILLALVPGLIRKRKAAAAEAEQTAAMAFPDFDSASTAADTTDGPQMDLESEKGSVASGVEPVAEETHDLPVDIAPAPASAVAGEEDPLAEVNVFLAYEHFDQAEEFVRDAISRQPENLDFHSKLLEVFYSAGDRVKYEEEARVLHDLTGGSGPHWDMAMIMWQEMSPSRALFSAPAEGEDSVAGTGSASGIVDLTADDDAGDDSALDFDLGMAMADSAPAAKTGGTEDMLDITAGSEDVLDVTANESSQPEDDILDVTAAVGLEPAPAPEEEGLSLDLPAAEEQDILDISSAGSDDPLDVTAHSDLDGDQDENLLDISMSGLTPEAGSGETPAQAADDNLLDFDVAGMDIPEPTTSPAVEDEGGLELDFGSETSPGDDGLELSLDMDSNDNSGLELSLESSETPDTEGGIELDFSSVVDEEKSEDDVSLDIGIGDELDTPAASGIDIDMDSTVKMPKGAEISLDDLSVQDEDEDDEEDHTVFVPRTNDAGEQSADDENATKLDLAKAYVELGDTSNAISILEEVIAGGNPAQRKQAQELMSQI